MPKPHHILFTCSRSQKSCCKIYLWILKKTWGNWKVQQEGKWNFMTDNSRGKKCVTTKAMFLNRKLFLVFWQALVTERSDLPSWMIPWTQKQPHSFLTCDEPADCGVLMRNLPLETFKFGFCSQQWLCKNAAFYCPGCLPIVWIVLNSLMEVIFIPFSIIELTQYVHWQANLVQQWQKKAESLLWASVCLRHSGFYLIYLLWVTKASTSASMYVKTCLWFW